tara:strand:+ start:3746 stop:4078 length:333 start_codon:yes stop_codon:yes gene_type:complete
MSKQKDWYIKVADRAALIAALKGPSESSDTGTVYPHSIIAQDDDDNDVIMATHWVRVDEIGVIYAPTGEAVTGYHANLRKLSDKADTLIKHLEDGGHTITPPATPARGFA